MSLNGTRGLVQSPVQLPKSAPSCCADGDGNTNIPSPMADVYYPDLGMGLGARILLQFARFYPDLFSKSNGSVVELAYSPDCTGACGMLLTKLRKVDAMSGSVHIACRNAVTLRSAKKNRDLLQLSEQQVAVSGWTDDILLRNGATADERAVDCISRNVHVIGVDVLNRSLDEFLSRAATVISNEGVIFLSTASSGAKPQLLASARKLNLVTYTVSVIQLVTSPRDLELLQGWEGVRFFIFTRRGPVRLEELGHALRGTRAQWCNDDPNAAADENSDDEDLDDEDSFG